MLNTGRYSTRSTTKQPAKRTSKQQQTTFECNLSMPCAGNCPSIYLQPTSCSKSPVSAAKCQPAKARRKTCHEQKPVNILNHVFPRKLKRRKRARKNSMRIPDSNSSPFFAGIMSLMRDKPRKTTKNDPKKVRMKGSPGVVGGPGSS